MVEMRESYLKWSEKVGYYYVGWELSRGQVLMMSVMNLLVS
jgi:hypothetical protein